jgi:hypothetical protein
MKYASGAAFRMALEDRLRAEARSTGLPLSRLRMTVAFDRLLARMAASSPDGWLLKGGFALQLQLENQARATKDIDLLLLAIDVSSHAMLLVSRNRSHCTVGLWSETMNYGQSHESTHGVKARC